MGLYEPSKEKERVQEIRDIHKAVREKKARRKKEKREKYKTIYKTEFAKQKAKLQAQKEIDVEQYKTTKATEKAKRHARARVKPFAPRNGLKAPSMKIDKTKVRKGIKTSSEFALRYGKLGMKTLDRIYGGKSTPRKRTKHKTVKRKTVKHKKVKPKGKTYYCRKCHKRHSYTSKIGKKHRR